MKKLLILFLFICSLLHAEDIFVSDGGTGSGTGVDASNTHSMAWLNNASNWGAGADKISPGDTVHLVGTIATTWTVAGSGTAGNIITVLFEPNAKFSKPYWGTIPTCAIYGSGRSYITIDGGTNGKIENTDNGTALGHQQQSYGIAFDSGGTNLTFRRLLISLYIRTPNSEDNTGAAGVGIHDIDTDGVDNITIEYCALNDSKLGTNLSLDGTSGTLTIRHNTSAHCSTNYQAAVSTGNATGRIDFYDNTVLDDYYWDYVTTPDMFHGDGLHLFTGSGKISNVDIHQNSLFGNFGNHSTSPLFMEGNFGAIRIWSNLIGSTLNKFEATVDLGSVAYPGTPTSLILYNNTIIGKSSTNQGNAAVYLNDLEVTGGNWSSVVARNNIFAHFYSVWAVPDNMSPSIYDLDYNGYFDVGNAATLYTPPSSNQTASKGLLSAWVSYLGGGDESHARTDDPLFVGSGSYQLQSGSPYINVGVSLSSPYNVTQLGNTISTPDIGAYDFGESGGGGDTTAPTPNPSTIAGTPTVLGTSSYSVTASLSTDAGSPPVLYRFSKDGGSTWTTFQSGQTYTFTGLTANTGYPTQVEAEDSASVPNVTTASGSTTVTTNAAVSTTPRILAGAHNPRGSHGH